MNIPTPTVYATTAQKNHAKPPHVNNILLIEDELATRLLFKNALTKAGYNVQAYDSHDDVHDLLSRGELSPKPDLILSDNSTHIRVHGLNGITFAEKYGPTFPIILCSSNEDAIHLGKTNGQFKATLPKPVSPHHLLDTVNSVANEIPAPTLRCC